LRSFSARDYAHLVALYVVDPWGPERDNYHAAMILAQTANINRPRHSLPVSPQRFMLGQSTTADEQRKIAALRMAIRAARENQVH